MIFNIKGSQSQVSTIEKALARCTFPYDDLLPGLQKAVGKDQIDVSFRALGPRTGGLSSSAGWIEISTSLGEEEAQGVFLMESAHAVDFFYMTDAQRHAIYNAFHPSGPDNHSWFKPSTYWNEVGEAFMDAFVWAFSDLRPASQFNHPPSEAIAASIRRIFNVGPNPPVPNPPTPTPPVAPGLTLEEAIDAVTNGVENGRPYFWSPAAKAEDNAVAALKAAWKQKFGSS